MIDSTFHENIISRNIKIKEKLEMIQQAFKNGTCDETLTSLACALIISSKKDNELIKNWAKANLSKAVSFEVEKLHEILYLNQQKSDIRYRIVNRKAWQKKDFVDFINFSLSPTKNSIKLTSILVLIKEYGLIDSDIEKLTVQMAHSGKQFNYLKSEDLANKIILRRYPTGGVSEKTALIMPSLLKCLSKMFNIASPFLVARTLSFTGGTWDKLSCIPGFTFPLPGKESIEKLKNGAVCMTVTKGDYNPSDKYLYQLRSITNTVNSIPLIVTSIVSKQLANPAHNLLLDIRYGRNAFLNSKKEAIEFFKIANVILEKNNISTIAEYTDSNIINGSSIGNYLEVIESICLMKNQTTYTSMRFDKGALNTQKDLVIKFTSKIMSKSLNLSEKKIETICEEFFSNGRVFDSFVELLLDHGVSKKIITKIKNNEGFIQGKPLKEYPIRAKNNGTIQTINTKKIGEYVNIYLNAGTNIFSNSKNYYNGVLILSQLNDLVNKGDILATIFSQKKIQNTELTNTFFEIC